MPGTATITPATTDRDTKAITRGRANAGHGVALAAIVGWSLFAFAGAYRWTFVPIAAAAVALALWTRPAILSRHRALDGALVAALLVGASQLVPLGASVREALSPSAGVVDATLRLAPPPQAEPKPPAPLATLSLDPLATVWALAFAVACALIFWSARTLFEEEGGVRRLCRAIAWMGLAAAALTFVQRAATPDRIYGFWTPITRASNPTAFGPFVNRNDLAAWLILAVPLVLGLAVAHLASHVRTGSRLDFEAVLGPRMLSLVAAAGLMIALLLALASRSGAIGLAVGLLCFVSLAGRRLEGRRVAWLVAALAVLLLTATTYANMAVLAERIGETLPSGLGGRLRIWEETWPIVRDFTLTGVGLGAYQRAMVVYQQSPHDIFFNHAHNEFLQILVEGGLVLAVVAAVALAIAVAAMFARLRRDRTPLFWIRAGAASGIAAISAQSLFDTGLRMPANAVLFAVVAAIALHRGETVRQRPRQAGGIPLVTGR